MLIVACRQYLPGTVDDLQPGYTLSECSICGKKIQVSPRSVPLLGRAMPFCNVCAVKFATEHPEMVLDVAMTPEAHAQLERLIAKMKAESQ